MNAGTLLVSLAWLTAQALPGQDQAQTAGHVPEAQPSPGYVQPLPPEAPAPQETEGPLFPLWGDKVRKAGFELPPAFGVMINYYYQKSSILISDLKLGVNNGPLHDASFIQFGDSTAHANALAIRPSFMLLPFLSFYTVISSGSSVTEVNITSPVPFTTKAESGAFVVSLGVTGQFGYKGFFGVVDFNASVADVDRISDLMGSNLLSFRVGYNYRLPRPGQSFSFWLGTSGQVIGLETNGSVKLADVIPPPSQSTIDQINARCAEFRPNDPRGQACQDFATKLQDWRNGTDPAASVQYSLNKKPKDVWNMLAGTQFALNRNWYFRVEVGFLGSRTSVLVGTEYKFDI
jgi:hypothetical protein